MKLTTLLLTPYAEQNPDRRKELETCYRNNLQAGFDDIWLVVEEKDREYALRLMHTILNESKCNIILKVIGNNRPAFQEYINIANTYDENTIHCVMNSDIFIEPADLEKIKNLNWQNKLFVALSRHDVHEGGTFTLLDRQDSQDFFCWSNKCTVDNAFCALGMCGFDNSICWKFHEKGYKVVNLAKDIVIKHLHLVLGNNYREGGLGPVKSTHICGPPYFFAAPCFISDIK